MKKIIHALLVATICVVVAVGLNGCKKEYIEISTTTDVNIVDYLRRYPDQFSEFVKVLDRTNIAPFLNAYGTYTVFAPTNNAFKLYLQQIGKTSTDQLDTATLRSFCTLHIIQDTLPTRFFTDGKLPTPTMYGQYLLTSPGFLNGSSATWVNRQGYITQPNIYTGNGYIHVIEHVLQPAVNTLAAIIEGNPKFSIYLQALKATHWYDTINIAHNADTTRRWYTLLAESDSVLGIAGINSYADLKAKYCNTGDPTKPTDSLNLYMAYHILPGIKFLTDIISAPSHLSLAPQAVVTAKLTGQDVVLNETTFQGVLEPGITINRQASDNAAVNGVLHVLNGDIYLKVRIPVGVYWDVADQPELRKQTAFFRKPGKFLQFSVGQFADVAWQQGTLQYTVDAATGSNYFYWNDHLDFGLRTNAVVNNWIEFTTPLLVQGKYKVWICYRRGVHGAYTRVSVDGNDLNNVVDLTSYIPSTALKDSIVIESQGYKRYTNAPANISTQNAVLAGVADITTTDRHKIRLTCIKDFGSGASGVNLDMIHFIPVNMNQRRPLFAKNGTIVP